MLRAISCVAWPCCCTAPEIAAEMLFIFSIVSVIVLIASTAPEVSD